MQAFAFVTPLGRGYVSRGLNVMNQLGPWLFERTRHQFAEGSIDGHEHLVPFIETKTADEHAERPTCDALPNLADEVVKTVRVCLPDLVAHTQLQFRRVEFFVIKSRQALGAVQ